MSQSFINQLQSSELELYLNRNLTRAIKRGNPWVFADSLQERPRVAPGTRARLYDKQGRAIAQGFYNARSRLAFRVCTLNTRQNLDSFWAQQQFETALHWRQSIFDDQTTGYRLFNGEGDGLPGLVCDVYDDTAIIKLDGDGPAGFWQTQSIAHWLTDRLSLACVYERYRSSAEKLGRFLIGHKSMRVAYFLENSMSFTADIVQGQKTGFFLDQRDNRHLIQQVACGSRVLNAFGYTGGFSVYAGVGGAQHVTTLDIAKPALKMAETHWRMNGLASANHRTVAADVFAFLEAAVQQGERWDLVILDPPSFASSKQTVPKASAAYRRLIALGAAVTAAGGLLGAASCSSHINQEAFLRLCEEGISKARRRAQVVASGEQPLDHPTPLALPEFRYLKFVLMAVN